MAGSRAMLAAAMAAAMLAQGEGFYLPGVAPRKYVPGEQLMVKVNTLNRAGKRKRNRRTGGWGQRPSQKRALITLAEGDSIDLFEV